MKKAIRERGRIIFLLLEKGPPKKPLRKPLDAPFSSNLYRWDEI